MTFAAPIGLFVCAILVPILAALLLRADAMRRRALARFGALELLSAVSRIPRHRERMIQGTIRVLAIALVCVALARPQAEGEAQSERRAGADVMFVLDLSRSMNVSDAVPTRLGAAKQAAATIARALPSDRMGLIVFGGSAFLSLAPTLDHSTFQTFVDAAGSTDIPDLSTNFEDAANVVAATLDSTEDSRSRAVVVLSDGEDTEGKLEHAIQILRDAHLRIYTVGVGTAAGGVVPDRDSLGLVVPHPDPYGGPAISHLVEQNLRDIAGRTGGMYVHWMGNAADVRPIIDALRRLPVRTDTERVRAPEAEWYQWALLLAVVLLLLGPVTDRLR